MTTKEEIQKTLMDCKYLQRLDDIGDSLLSTIVDRMGQNGFENAHTWKSKIGGL